MVITKATHITGATSDKTLYVIDGTGLPSPPDQGIVINVNVTNVTIRDLTVQVSQALLAIPTPVFMASVVMMV
ncbi:MAG: hypothetical protein IPH94_21835 [Saprospiraceae bacterium]|nr:hypothetical protein [Saprospiraceae bacterium]